MSEKIRIANDSHGKLRRRQTSNAIKPLPKTMFLFALALFCTAFTTFVEATNDKKLSLSNVGKILGFGKKQPAPPRTFEDKGESAGKYCNLVTKYDRGFAQYCNAAYQSFYDNRPSSLVLTMLDIKHLSTIAAMENKRNPGLNLVHIEDKQTEALLKSIQKAQANMKSGTVRFIFPTKSAKNPDGTQNMKSFHHALAEVMLGRSGTSVVIFDSAYAPTHEDLVDLKKMLEKQGWKVSIVAPEIQFTNFDCVMYSLSFALKSYKTNFGQKLNKQSSPVILDKDKRDQIPVEFFKHTQTNDLPDSLKNKPIDKTGRQLGNRYDDYMKLRDTDKGEKMRSTSIEGFRLQEIGRVGEAYEKGSSGFDRSLENLYEIDTAREYPRFVDETPPCPLPSTESSKSGKFTKIIGKSSSKKTSSL